MTTIRWRCASVGLVPFVMFNFMSRLNHFLPQIG